MNLSSVPLFEIMKGRLGYHSERQGVLAQNVANADTPGYRAQDIKAPDFRNLVASHSGGLRMTTTHPGHISASNGTTSKFKIDEREKTNERNPNDNNVSLDEEIMKVSQNQAEYQKTLNLYRKMLGLIKTAVSGSGGQP